MSKNSKYFSEFRATLPSMTDKTVVITGTTSGTGKVAAHTMADLGATVIVLNRSSERSVSSFAELSSAFPDSILHNVECDLQDFASVKSAVNKVKDLCPDGFDVLANNAGVMALADIATVDGFDIQMQTNHLSHFLLTCELMPLLEKASNRAGEARVVNHSSVARLTPSTVLLPEYLEPLGANLGGDGSALQNSTFQGPRWLRYNQTKLANAAFTAGLHHKLSKSGSSVKALVAHPGGAQTELSKPVQTAGGLSKLFIKLGNRIFQSAEDGAMGLIACMCLPEVESGEFWGPGSGVTALRGMAKPFALEPFYDNSETRDLLWRKSEAAIGKSFNVKVG